MVRIAAFTAAKATNRQRIRQRGEIERLLLYCYPHHRTPACLHTLSHLPRKWNTNRNTWLIKSLGMFMDFMKTKPYVIEFLASTPVDKMLFSPYLG